MKYLTEIICPCCGEIIKIESAVVNECSNRDTIPVVNAPRYEFGEQRGGEKDGTK